MNTALNESEHVGKRFANLDLSDTELSAKEFEDCEFRDCNFSGTTFLKCRFIECRFVQCNLSVANVNGAKFHDVEFESCKAIGIDWTRANWPTLTMPGTLKFRKCILNDSSFMNLKLPELVLDDCKARDADFREGNFTGADFNHTDFAGALFGKTHLVGADFTDAVNYDINVLNNEIRKAKFSLYEAVRLLDCLEIELLG
ncbi:MAG: pentapeptide repeat-containing protein [Pseudomonadota bacterium]